MPTNVVKTKRDEHLWSKAKAIAKKQYSKISTGSDKFYKIVMGIYNNMKGGSIIKSINSEDTMNNILKDYPLLAEAHIENKDDSLNNEHLEDFPLLQKARIKTHTRRTKGGKIVQVREHQDTRKESSKIHPDIIKNRKKVTQLEAKMHNVKKLLMDKHNFDEDFAVASVKKYKGVIGISKVSHTEIAEKVAKLAHRTDTPAFQKDKERFSQKPFGKMKDPEGSYRFEDEVLAELKKPKNKVKGHNPPTLVYHHRDALISIHNEGKFTSKQAAGWISRRMANKSLDKFPLLQKAHVKTHPRKMKSGKVTQVREHETSVQKKRAEAEIKRKGGVEQHKYKLGDTYKNTNGNMDLEGMFKYAINKVPTKLTTQTPMHPLAQLFESLQDANYHRLAAPLFDALKLEGNGLRKEAEPFLVEFVARAKAEAGGKKYTGKLAMDTAPKKAKDFFHARNKAIDKKMEEVQARYKKNKEVGKMGAEQAKKFTKVAQQQSRAREVAKIIHTQIGHQALFMMGAKNLSAGTTEDGKPYLGFRIGRNSKSINYIKVILDEGQDLYNIEFGRIRKGVYKVVTEDKGMYFDQLHESFERNTGLYVRLGIGKLGQKKIKKSIKRKLQIGDTKMKSTKESTQKPILDSVKFPLLGKAHAKLKKSISFKIGGQKLKTAIDGKIATCRGELIVLEKEYPPVPINSEDVSAKVSTVGEEAPVTKVEVKVADHWKVRSKKREIKELETYARNVNVKITYSLDKYELVQFGL